MEFMCMYYMAHHGEFTDFENGISVPKSRDFNR